MFSFSFFFCTNLTYPLVLSFNCRIIPRMRCKCFSSQSCCYYSPTIVNSGFIGNGWKEQKNKIEAKWANLSETDLGFLSGYWFFSFLFFYFSFLILLWRFFIPLWNCYCSGLVVYAVVVLPLLVYYIDRSLGNDKGEKKSYFFFKLGTSSKLKKNEFFFLFADYCQKVLSFSIFFLFSEGADFGCCTAENFREGKGKDGIEREGKRRERG